MTEDINYSFFTSYGKYFTPIHPKKNSILPFKEHPQLQQIVDTLSRKTCHHVFLSSEFSTKILLVFLEALAHHLTLPSIPKNLANADLIHLDIHTFFAEKINLKDVEHDFKNLRQTIETSDKASLFVLSSNLFKKAPLAIETFLREQFAFLLNHTQCRFIVLANKHERMPSTDFYHLNITKPSAEDVLALLNRYANELENFHHVVIPHELLMLAYNFAERYLNAKDTLENTLLLIDSAAARTAALEKTDHNQPKPTITISVLLQVLSSWTQIPESQLQPNAFKLNDFMQNMQQRIFGQVSAITLLGNEVQQAQIELQTKNSPYCSFLFIGAKHSGKKTTLLAFVEQLYKQLNVLYFARPTIETVFSKIKLERYIDKTNHELKNVIQQTPNAVIVFEDIDKATTVILECVQQILTTGYLHDDSGERYSFRHAIIILTTAKSTDRLNELAQTFTLNGESHDMDLMQLVMSEQKPIAFASAKHRSPQELIDLILPEINQSILPGLGDYVSVIPFLELTKSSLEKIMRLQLKMLCKQLDTRYGIELGFAPEVIRYLTDKVLQKQANQGSDIDKVVKQLYFCVEQTILNQAENKNRPSQLFLQLNETGHLLRCDWLVSSAVRQHAT